MNKFLSYAIVLVAGCSLSFKQGSEHNYTKISHAQVSQVYETILRSVSQNNKQIAVIFDCLEDGTPCSARDSTDVFRREVEAEISRIMGGNICRARSVRDMCADTTGQERIYLRLYGVGGVNGEIVVFADFLSGFIRACRYDLRNKGNTEYEVTWFGCT